MSPIFAPAGSPRLPMPHRRAVVAAICTALFVGVFVARTIESLDYLTVGILFVVPVALMAVEWGARTGLVAAAFATALLALALWVEGTAFHAEYLLIRGFVYVLVGGIVGWLADIGRREAQVSEAVLNQLAEPAAIKDRQGRYLMVNDAFLRTVGAPREAVIGRTAHDVGQSQATVATHMRAEQEVLRTGAPVEIEFEVTSPSGETRQFISSKSPILGERSGVPIGTLTVSHDISSRVEHERDVASTAARERAAYAEAQFRYHQLIRHRLANPLTVIRAGAFHLQSDAPVLDTARIGRMIEEQVERIERLSLRPASEGEEERVVDATVDAATPSAEARSEQFRQDVRPIDARGSEPADAVEAEHSDEGVAG